jgi:LysM repeat protein
VKLKPAWVALACLALVLLWLRAAGPAFADTIYIVQPGDNLFRISLRFGVSEPAVMAANGLTDPSRIYAGQQLVIPGPGTPVPAVPAQASALPTATAAAAATPPPASPAAATYVVQPGDTLHRIAVQFGVSEYALMELNGILNPNRISAGQTLQLPGAAAQAVPSPAATATAAPLPTAAPAATVSAGSYVVQAGDTLWALAGRFGVTVAEIRQANHLTSGWLYVGQSLVMPGAPAGPVAPGTVLSAAAGVRPAGLPAWIPTITARMHQIYAQSSAQGHDPAIFTVVGDCNSDTYIYLGPVGAHMLDLTGNTYLNATIDRFSTSFVRHSLAAHGGFNAGSMMDPAWADPSRCERGEGPLACELRDSHASIVFIALGTGDQFSWTTFETHYRSLIDYTLSRGVLPVLVTKADALESIEGGAAPGYINSVIRRLGQEYEVPVLDFWLAVRDLPNGGLQSEGGHDFHLNTPGIARHILATLQTLDVIWR